MERERSRDRERDERRERETREEMRELRFRFKKISFSRIDKTIIVARKIGGGR